MTDQFIRGKWNDGLSAYEIAKLIPGATGVGIARRLKDMKLLAHAQRFATKPE